MAYFADLVIPANTPAETPVSLELKIAAGVVKRVEVVIPDGVAGLAGVRFMYWERQVWPDNPGEWFTGNGTELEFSPNAEVTQTPTVIRMEGYNDDDTFEHRFLAMIDVEFAGGWWDRLLQQLKGPSSVLAMPGR